MLNAFEFLSAKRFARGLCLAIAAFGLCCAAGAAESVQITGGTRAEGLINSLTVAFSAREKAATLWLASGKTDAGETLGNWEKLDFLADVPAGATSCTCSVAPYADLPVVRVLLIENNAELTELESVSATGTQYVDTQYTPCGTTAVKCEFKIDTLTPSALFGARQSSTKGEPMFCLLELANSGGNGFRCDYDEPKNSTTVHATPGAPYLAEMDYRGLKLNGSEVSGCQQSGKPWTATMPCTMMVFAMNSNGEKSSPAKATFYWFKAWDVTGDPSSLALDLVPCQKEGEGVGFWDRKKGEFRSSSDGTLTAGTPKAHSSLGALVAASASFGAGSAPWAENAVSVTGSARDAKGLLSSLIVAFPATTKASSLWLAWGKEDAGDLLGNWEELDFLADVQAGATSCTCPVSVTPRHSGLTVARVFLLENDAELTELESVSSAGDSNQFVDTRYVPNGKTGVRCDFSFDKLKGSALFGARTSTSANQFCLLELLDNGFRIDYAEKQSNTLSLQNGAPVACRRYVAEMDYTGLLINGKHINDRCKLTDGVKTVFPGQNLYLFAMNNNGTGSSPAAATIYSFKAWNETGVKSTLKCDLVPCQKNGVVSFYDRKNGKFLPVSGTLTAGSAKAHSSLGGLAGYSGALRPYGDGRGMTVKDVFRATRRVKAVLELDAALSDSTLLAAFGPEDKGENLADWFKSDGTVAEGATVRVVAAVPGEATSFTATVPDVIDENMKVFRFFLVSRFGGEDYDRVLDGVRATGTQYVQTDIVPTGTFSVQAQFKFDAVGVSQCLFGAREASGVNAFALLHTYDYGFRYDYNGKTENTQIKAGYDKFLCVMNSSGLDYTKDGESTTTHYSRPQSASTDFTAGGKFAIFGLNTAGEVGVQAKAVCYRLWAWKTYGTDTTRCLDLVPCVKNGEVGFYNKIGGGFLGNAGTDAFEAVEAADGEQANAAARVFASSDAFPTPPPPGAAIIIR